MKNAIDVLVDISDNMEGNRKPFAQRLVNEEIVPYLPFSEIVGLKTFMAAGPVCLVIRSLDLQNNSKSDFEQKINNLPMPNSGAPIAEAVKESAAEFAKKAADAPVKRMVMVTAGVDTLVGNYLPAVEDAAKNGIQFNIVVIGGSDSVKNDALEAAKAGNGVACFVSDSVYDSADVKSALKPLVDVLNGASAPVAQAPAAPAPKQQEVVVERVQTIDIDEVKDKIPYDEPVVAKASEQVVAEPVVEAPKAEAFEPVVVASVADKQDEKQTSVLDLDGIVRTNNLSMADLQKQASDNIASLLRKTESAISEIQSKAATEISSLLGSFNSSVADLAQKNKEAFDVLADQKAASDAKVNLLVENDKKVVIDTDVALENEIAVKSQKFLNAYLQKKYTGRVCWVNENGAANKGYDFQIEDADNDNSTFEYVIACKGLLDDSKSFVMTKSEWLAFTSHSRNYQVYIIGNLASQQPTLTLIDNLKDWLLKGLVVPCADKNIKLKADSVVLTIV